MRSTRRSQPRAATPAEPACRRTRSRPSPLPGFGFSPRPAGSAGSAVRRIALGAPVRFIVLKAASLLASTLPDSGTIGVPAPASPWENRSDLLRGVEWWEAQGYSVKLAPGIDGRDDFVAGSPQQRGEDLNALFADPEVDIVHCMQGGYGSAQAIPFLDFDVIAANPKRHSSPSMLSVLRQMWCSTWPLFWR